MNMTIHLLVVNYVNCLSKYTSQKLVEEGCCVLLVKLYVSSNRSPLAEIITATCGLIKVFCCGQRCSRSMLVLVIVIPLDITIYMDGDTNKA